MPCTLNTVSSHIIKFVSIILLIATGYGAMAQSIRIPEIPSASDFGAISKDDTLTIRVLGDMMMHQQQITAAATKEDSCNFDSYFTHIQKYLDSSDLNIANMEFTLAGKPHTGYPAFSAPDEYARHIADCGIDIFLTANNHIYDKGGKGLSRTLDIYRELQKNSNIRFTGSASDQTEFESTTPLVIEVKDVKIALINATYGTNLGTDKHWPKTNYLNNRTMMENALKVAEAQADITIVLPHWGEEYQLRHNHDQAEKAKWLAENGADIIIGSHPHVVQDADSIVIDGRKIPVAYSLGNVISNMSAANTQTGLMATIKIIRKINGSVEVLPLEFTYLWCSRPGGYCNSYTILPLKEFLGSREEWYGKWEYDKMATTYTRVAEKTGIKEN